MRNRCVLALGALALGVFVFAIPGAFAQTAPPSSLLASAR
jgi:hypothetical protein